MENLIWKQWREFRFHFFIFSTWMILAAGYAIAYELGHHYRAAIGSFSSAAMLYAIVAAIVLAARASQGEQADRTLSFTASLPISIRRVATVRIVGALLTLAVPVVMGASIVAFSLVTGLIEQAAPRLDPAHYIQLEQRSVGEVVTALEQLVSVTCIAVLGGVELLLVVSLGGLSLRSQAQVGALGTVVALGFAVVAEPLWHGARWPLGQLFFGAILPQSLVVHWGYGGDTGGYVDHELARYRWLSLALALPLLSAIAWCAIIRYGKNLTAGRATKPSRFRIAMPSVLSKITIPLPTRWAALMWLELRQALPLAVYGLILAILITIVGQLGENRMGYDLATAVRSELSHSVFFVGMLWAIVIGSSLYSADLDRKVGGFRRTRPIPHAMWFWNKFFVGLAAILLVMDGTTILVAWGAPKVPTATSMSYAYVACFPILHALMYTLAVFGACLFRRPLIGGVLAMLSYGVVTIAITAFPGTMRLEPVTVFNNLLHAEQAGVVDFTQYSYPIVYGWLLTVAFILSIVSLRLAKPLGSSSPY